MRVEETLWCLKILHPGVSTASSHRLGSLVPLVSREIADIPTSRRPLPSHHREQHSLLLRRCRHRSQNRQDGPWNRRRPNRKLQTSPIHLTYNKSHVTPNPPNPQHQCIRNLSAVLTAAGSSLDAVFKVNVFLSDMEHFTAMNEVYKTYWGEVKPARTCVAVKQLPLGTDVEIECQAVLP